MSVNQSGETTVADRERDAKAILDHWTLFLGEGAALVVLGLAAVVVPPLAASAATDVFGTLFLFSGLIGLLTTFWARHVPGYFWSLVSAALGILVGILLLSQRADDLYDGLYIGWPPIRNVAPLTLILVVFFAIEGIASIKYALAHRREASGRWNWMLASGAIDLGLAIFVVLGLSGMAAWSVGLLVGVNMVFGGVALIAMALHARVACR